MNEWILKHEANLHEKSKEYLYSPECAELDAKIESHARMATQGKPETSSNIGEEQIMSTPKKAVYLTATVTMFAIALLFTAFAQL